MARPDIRRRVQLAEGLLTARPVLSGIDLAPHVLVTAPGTETLLTADQADAMADMLRAKATAARDAAAKVEAAE
ncbi:hypothetical protein [Reyranella sp.]|uniref:hypothetical protein n=1 Tax=Reyranella sp. TaxID=1929291 RepID=UPI0027313B22|nr:hypothetical protein [Reyranella sp.]MDP2376557.1 hypothetical protein [Reyranella sp.]